MLPTALQTNTHVLGGLRTKGDEELLINVTFQDITCVFKRFADHPLQQNILINLIYKSFDAFFKQFFFFNFINSSQLKRIKQFMIFGNCL